MVVFIFSARAESVYVFLKTETLLRHFNGLGWIYQAKPTSPANFDQQNNCSGQKTNLKISSPRSDFGSYLLGDMNSRVTKEKKK